MTKHNQLTELKELLERDDDALNDEINALFAIVKYGLTPDEHEFCQHCNWHIKEWSGENYRDKPKYTTSIDAQAAIMPDGFLLSVKQYTRTLWVARLGDSSMEDAEASTEVRARLLAIVLVMLWREDNE